LNASIVSLHKFRLTRNFKCLYFSFIDNDFSENFFFYLSFDILLSFFDDFLDFFPYNFNFLLVVNLLLNFLNLIDKASYWHISVGLNFNWDLFIVNVVLWFIDFDDVRLFNDFRNVDWEQLIVVFVNNFVHIEEDLFRDFDDALYLNDLLSQDFYFFWHLNVFDGFRTRDLPHNLDLHWLFDPNLHDFRNGDSVSDRLFLFNNLGYFDNILNYFFSDDGLFDNKLNRNLLFERHDYLSVFYCDLMNFNYLFNDSIPKDFNWNFPYNLGWNSSLDFDFFGNFFLNDEFDRFLSFHNLDLFDVLNDWLLDDDLPDDLDLPDYWNLPKNFNNL